MALRIARNLRMAATSAGLSVLTIGTQPQVESSDGRIAANSRRRRHVQEARHLGAVYP
jgi:hypothetical protein